MIPTWCKLCEAVHSYWKVNNDHEYRWRRENSGGTSTNFEEWKNWCSLRRRGELESRTESFTEHSLYVSPLMTSCDRANGWQCGHTSDMHSSPTLQHYIYDHWSEEKYDWVSVHRFKLTVNSKFIWAKTHHLPPEAQHMTLLKFGLEASYSVDHHKHGEETRQTVSGNVGYGRRPTSKALVRSFRINSQKHLVCLFLQ